MKSTFDIQAFYVALDAKRDALNLSWRQVARETGIPPATFTRLGQDKLPESEAFVTILCWLGMDVKSFVSQQTSQIETLSIIATALHNDLRLQPEHSRLIDTLIREMYKTLTTR